MMVRLYDYLVPVANDRPGIRRCRRRSPTCPPADRKTLLTSLFKPERMPGSMERLTTLVLDVDISFGDLLTVLDNAARERRFVAIDEARPILDRVLPPSAIEGTREWDVARLHEPYGDGTYHGPAAEADRKQLRSVGSREALTTPFLFRREW